MVSLNKRHSAPPTIKPKGKQLFVRVLKISNNLYCLFNHIATNRAGLPISTWRHHLDKLFKVIN